MSLRALTASILVGILVLTGCASTPAPPAIEAEAEAPHAGPEDEMLAEWGEISALTLPPFATPLFELSSDPVYPAPRVTVNGATAATADYADFRSGSSEMYPTIQLLLQDAEGNDLRTINGSPTLSSVLVTTLTPGASYRMVAVEMAWNEDWTAQIEVRRSETSATFTTRDEILAPGVVPDVPTLEALNGSEMRVSWPSVDSGGDVRTWAVSSFVDGLFVDQAAATV